MLLNNLYTILEEKTEGDTTTYRLELNPDHEIFKGHFPGMPVLPGVCMMEIVKEVLEKQKSVSTRLKKAGNLKFLSIVNPREHRLLDLELKIKSEENATLSISANLKWESTLFFKMDAGFSRS